VFAGGRVTFSDAPPKRWLDGHEDAAERSGTVARSGGLTDPSSGGRGHPRRAGREAPRRRRGDGERGPKAPPWHRHHGGQGGNAPCKPRRIHDHRRGCMCSTSRLASAALNRPVLCFGTTLAPLWHHFGIALAPLWHRFIVLSSPCCSSLARPQERFFGLGCPISLSPTPSVRCRADLGPLRGYPKRNPLPRAPSPGPVQGHAFGTP
jgi:hypothetical protein